ncbi:hypothetical protein JR316_0011200 [Psilocybe cubensis]|uniref:Uncharacterized protein n=2 Tax=Psilocybe cubensis TaxID=181762 RepID=A0ACB8GIU1_PSICU|nr:hypothetical protein JR316_0011200 [Psilocybe cubensis]KAH9475645.1 hypothetical protein JR316_0011200 [Psilocybe cubensis]
MYSFSSYDFLNSGLSADSSRISPEREPSLCFASDSPQGSSSTGSQQIQFLSRHLDLSVEPTFVEPSSYPALDLGDVNIFAEWDAGFDSYPPFSNSSTQVSSISGYQQASTSSSTFEPSLQPTTESLPNYPPQSVEDINQYMPTSNPRNIFPESTVESATAAFGLSSTSMNAPSNIHTPPSARLFAPATHPLAIHQALSSRCQSRPLENFGKYPSPDVADGNPSYLSTASTSVAPKNVHGSRYIDILHGGIWLIDSDPRAQVENTLTRVVTEDEKRKQQLLPTLESVEKQVLYYNPGSRAILPGSSTDSFHSYIRGKETTNQEGSMWAKLNCEESSGGNPVEPLDKFRHGNGGMVSHHSTTQNGDRQVATASRYTRKRRLSAAKSNEGKSPSAAKRPRTASPLVRGSGTSTSAQTEVLQDQEGSVSRVAATLTAAPRPLLQPAQPRCLAEGFSQGRLVIEKRERHRKKDGGLTFQVMRPT